ncbi:MAG: zinc ribbon domain-containing protein [Gemmatimonadetes bacterium]|nr:zinc ribbon domain-containing protein [Gemmatimonadota bacterium]
MPTYGYRCPTCGHEYEKLQKISDATRIKCPRCGKRGERLISGGAGIIFKGSGFYETDYKRAGSAGAKEKTSSDGDKPSKDTSKKPSSGADKSESSKGTDRPKGDKS